VSQSKPTRPVDAMIARLLYQLPLYQAWDEIELPADLKSQIDEAGQQRLMCIAAYSLQRLMVNEQDDEHKDCA